MDAPTIPTLLEDTHDVLDAERLLTLSRINCRMCIKALGGGMAPSHSNMMLVPINGGGIGMANWGCESNSLRYNPISRSLIGHSHCTCDACF